MRYTLRQLEVFLAVADEQNLTKAANKLSMSQSAASSALKELEERYDIQLFDRIGKRLQLNEHGQFVRNKAEALVAQAEELDRTLLKHAEAGPINVGATLSIGNYLAVRLIAKYMENFPDSYLSLHVANTHDIVEKVLNYELDVGLIEGDINHHDLSVYPWRTDELAIFCRPEHPLAALQQDQGFINKEDIINAKWIMREPGSGTRQAFERVMHGLFPQLHIVLELQHTEAIKRAVEAGLGIGCLSSITLEDAFKRGSLVHLQLPNWNLERQLYLIVRKQKYLSTGIKSWMDYCLKN